MKKIKVKIKNKWLNALEDFLTAQLNEEQTAKHKRATMKLWKALVAAWDKEKKLK